MFKAYSGTLLKHPKAIFLNVEEVAPRLEPILNHKAYEKNSCGPFPRATLEVLVKLGILLPVRITHFWGGETTAAGEHYRGQPCTPAVGVERGSCGGGFLVLRRLPLDAPPEVVRRMEALEGCSSSGGWRLGGNSTTGAPRMAW